MKKILFFVVSIAVMTLSTNASAWWWSKPSTYTQTKHPIVLVHGLYGFDDILGMEYFYKVPAELRKDGAEVYTVTVAQANSTEVRGEQLLAQMEDILAVSGAQKLNLIGHSHGGPTIRYAASVRPDMVASVTSIAGVNKGTPVADKMLAASNGSAVFSGLIEFAGNLLGNVIDLFSSGDYDQDVMAVMSSLSTEETMKFNQRHPQGVPTTACGEGAYSVEGIHYYSWTGIQPVTNIFDPIEALFAVTSQFFDKGVDNDGLVGRCSSHLGMVIRDDFKMNHLDEVNLMLGIHHLWSTDEYSNTNDEYPALSLLHPDDSF
jgi:triacylglycerol lipase